MYYPNFEELEEELKQQGRIKNPSHEIAYKIRYLYVGMYARPDEYELPYPFKSSDIVRKLADDFPKINVCEVLRPVMDYTRA